MMNSPIVIGVSSLLAVALVLIARLRKHGKPDRKDAGALFVALFAGFSFPKGIFLAGYLFSPDPPGTLTKLQGFEKEIFAAGVLIAFLAVVSVWSLCEES